MYHKRTLSPLAKQRTHDASSPGLQECAVLLDFLGAVRVGGSLFRQPGVGRVLLLVAMGEGGAPMADHIPPPAIGDLNWFAGRSTRQVSTKILPQISSPFTIFSILMLISFCSFY